MATINDKISSLIGSVKQHQEQKQVLSSYASKQSQGMSLRELDSPDKGPVLSSYLTQKRTSPSRVEHFQDVLSNLKTRDDLLCYSASKYSDDDPLASLASEPRNQETFRPYGEDSFLDRPAVMTAYREAKIIETQRRQIEQL